MAGCQVAFCLSSSLPALVATSDHHCYPLFPQVPWLLRLAPLYCSSNSFLGEFLSTWSSSALTWGIWPVWEIIQHLPCQILEAWLFQHCPSSSLHCSWSHKFFLAQVRKVLYSPLQGWEWSPSHWNLSKENSVSSLPLNSLVGVHGWTLVPLFSHLRSLICQLFDWQTTETYFENSTWTEKQVLLKASV